MLSHAAHIAPAPSTYQRQTGSQERAAVMRTRCATALLQSARLPSARWRLRAAPLCRAPRPAPLCRAQRVAASSSAAVDAALPFTLKNVDVQISDWGAVRVVLPASEDEVLDHYIETNRGDADPFFCSIWPSSIALAENLLKQPKLALGKRVVDAGCGLGLGGVAAALAGARAVVLADREPFALRCALQTAQANGLTPLPLELAASAAAGPVVRSVLQPASGAAGSGTIGALELDWHAPPAELRGCFDVMTACDVLYEKDAAVPVAALALHLLAPGGTLLLADPPLRTPGNRKDFLALLDGKFEAVKTEEQRIFDADGKPVDVCICIFTGKR